MKVATAVLLIFCVWAALVSAKRSANDEEEIEKTEEQLAREEELKREGFAFLNEVFIKPDIIKLKTGLLFEKMKTSDNIFAKSPRPQDFCTVSYIGSYINGTVFENDTKQRKPEQLIPGWKQAMQLMAEGDRWRMYLAYTLHFGENGLAGKVDPFSTLIYELELVECPDAGRTIADAREALEEALLPPERDPTSPHYVIQNNDEPPAPEPEPEKKKPKKKNKKITPSKQSTDAPSEPHPPAEALQEKEVEERKKASEPSKAEVKPKKKKSKAKVGFARSKKKDDDDDEL